MQEITVGQGGIGDPSPEHRVPWNLGDVAKALVVPGFFVMAGFLTILFGGEEEKEYDQATLIVGLIFSALLQFVLLGSVVWLAIRKHGAEWSALGVKPWRGDWWFPLALVILSLAVVYIYLAVLTAFGVEVSDIPDEVFDNVAPLVILGVISLALAPLIEEIFFRGFVFGAFRGRYGLTAGVVISGLIFGAAHLGNAGSVLIFLPISGVGMIFAWGYAYSGSLVPTMIAHFLFNLLVFSVGVASA
jgi:membrane protease YdiL (CAAX protease family)